MELLINLGLRLKTIRTYAGIKQKDLAKELEIPAPLLSLYEQGKREPSITFLDKFCNYLQISLSELFSFNINKNQKASPEFNGILNDLSQLMLSLEKLKFNAGKEDSII
jgi:transcriptional regulator with XRE-family HTH domain